MQNKNTKDTLVSTILYQHNITFWYILFQIYNPWMSLAFRIMAAVRRTLIYESHNALEFSQRLFLLSNA